MPNTQKTIEKDMVLLPNDPPVRGDAWILTPGYSTSDYTSCAATPQALVVAVVLDTIPPCARDFPLGELPNATMWTLYSFVISTTREGEVTLKGGG